MGQFSSTCPSTYGSSLLLQSTWYLPNSARHYGKVSGTSLIDDMHLSSLTLNVTSPTNLLVSTQTSMEQLCSVCSFVCSAYSEFPYCELMAPSALCSSLRTVCVCMFCVCVRVTFLVVFVKDADWENSAILGGGGNMRAGGSVF